MISVGFNVEVPTALSVARNFYMTPFDSVADTASSSVQEGTCYVSYYSSMCYLDLSDSTLKKWPSGDVLDVGFSLTDAKSACFLDDRVIVVEDTSDYNTWSYSLKKAVYATGAVTEIDTFSYNVPISSQRTPSYYKLYYSPALSKYALMLAACGGDPFCLTSGSRTNIIHTESRHISDDSLVGEETNIHTSSNRYYFYSPRFGANASAIIMGTPYYKCVGLDPDIQGRYASLDIDAGTYTYYTNSSDIFTVMGGGLFKQKSVTTIYRNPSSSINSSSSARPSGYEVFSCLYIGEDSGTDYYVFFSSSGSGASKTFAAQVCAVTTGMQTVGNPIYLKGIVDGDEDVINTGATLYTSGGDLANNGLWFLNNNPSHAFLEIT